MVNRSITILNNIFRPVLPPFAILALLILLGLVENGISLAFPWFAGTITKQIFSQHGPGTFSVPTLLSLLFLLSLLQLAVSYVNRLYSAVTTEKMLGNLRTRLYEHVQSLPVSFFSEQKHGQTLSLLTHDCVLLSIFLTNTVLAAGPLAVTSVGAMICLYWISPRILGVILIVFPVTVLLIKLLAIKIRPRAKQFLDSYSATVTLAEENLANIPLIKSFSREPLESARFVSVNKKLLQHAAQFHQTHSLLAPLTRFAALSGILAFIWFMKDALAVGTFSSGELVSMLLYIALLIGPISRFADMYGSFQHAVIAAERLSAVIARAPENYQDGITLSDIRGEIAFRNVHFSYPGRSEVLRGVTLIIASGETIAITGENGAGKSSLVHLIMRFIAPTHGTIFLDGHDISSLSLVNLRSHIGVVQQHIFLQNASVADNILFGKADASEEELRAAADAADALDFIEKLPQGFATEIGDKGVKLSGGQRQRIALSRAILKNPPILILDEPTAMFDPQGEHQFITRNRKLLAGKTVIIITHRPASLALADRILHLHNGVITLTANS